MSRALLAIVVLCAVSAMPPATADPDSTGPEGSAVASETVSATGNLEQIADSGDPVAVACNGFAAALALAAANYEEFAYATAGGGDYVNYGDANVQRSNVIGRAALKESAAAALRSSGVTGLPADIAEPMRAWSLHATKLLVIMGVHGGGDSLNNAATQLNSDADRAQIACAAALAVS